MSKSHEKISETHIVGRATKERIAAAIDCPILRSYHIKHVGVADAAAP